MNVYLVSFLPGPHQYTAKQKVLNNRELVNNFNRVLLLHARVNFTPRRCSTNIVQIRGVFMKRAFLDLIKNEV